MYPGTVRLLWLLGPSAAWVIGCSQPGTQQLEAGRRALGRGQYREAIALYTEVTLEASGSPQAAQALLDIGAIYYLRLRDLDAARASFRKLIAEYPQTRAAREGRRMMARMYEEDLGEPEKAIEEYKQMLAEASDAAEEKSILLSVANCLYALNRLTESASAYRRVIEEFPYDKESDQAFIRLAHIEALQGQGEQALAVLERLLGATQQQESRLRAYQARTEVFLVLGRYDEAGACLGRAEDEFPDRPDLSALRLRLDQHRQGEMSLDGGERESQEILKALQETIPWGRARGPRR
ncbi:MAG: tetratricopeptide repeat protein [Acidobacteriota bacterium]